MTIEDRLSELNITLPEAPAPAANYVPYVISGNMVYISGQIAIENGQILTGKLGDDISIEEGQRRARVCAINLISQLKSACGGDLEKVKRVVRLGGFVNCTADFNQQPAIVNGASDLMVDVFGEKGRHARAAVGSNALPLDTSVEVDGIFEIAT